MEEGELPVLAGWIHVPVSRSAEKRGLRGSINMRMTRTTWFLRVTGCTPSARIFLYQLLNSRCIAKNLSDE